MLDAPDALVLFSAPYDAGISRRWSRENGHTMTNARPMTLLIGIVPPPGNPLGERETAES